MILSPRDAQLFAAATLTPEIAQLNVPVREDFLFGCGLRDYQLKMLLEAAALFRLGYRRVLIQCPTGGGKTRMAAALMACASALGRTSQFLVHRKELIKQTSGTFTDVGLPHGFIANGWALDYDAQVTLAGIQTLVSRLGLFLPPNLVVVDEAHHATAASWANTLAAYPDTFVLGLTATPERLDGRGLDEHFDVMVKGPSVSWLIKHGYLAPFEFYAPDVPDMSDVPIHGPDFAKGAAAEVVDRPEIIGSIVDHYRRLAPGEQGIVFAASIQHSRNIAEEFNGRGYPAMHVDGTMKDGDRDRFDDAFRAGDILLGVNVGLFDEGYDVPNISYVGDGGPSKSVVKVRQRWGRGLRPPKRAVICDHAGNAMRLQDMPDMEREWSLAGRSKRAKGICNDDAEPVRQCLTCYRVYPSTLATCPGCGETTAPTSREIKQREGELKRLEAEMMKKAATAQRKAEEKACKSWVEFKQLAEARNVITPGRYEDPGKWASLQISMRTQYAKRFRR